MKVRDLRKALKGLPADAEVEVQVCLDDPETWDGNLVFAIYRPPTPGLLDARPELESGVLHLQSDCD